MGGVVIRGGRGGARRFSGASVYNTDSINVAADTDTVLPAAHEDYDTDGYHDIAINNSRLVAPFDGYYRIGVAVRFFGAANGVRRVFFRKNGVTEYGRVQVAPAGSTEVFVHTSVTVQLDAGNYVEALVRHTNNLGALNCYTDSFVPFQIELVGT